MTNQEPIPFKSLKDLPIDEPVLIFFDDCWLTVQRNGSCVCFLDFDVDKASKRNEYAITKDQISRITHWMHAPPAPPEPLDDAEAFKRLIKGIHLYNDGRYNAVHHTDKEELYITLLSDRKLIDYLQKRNDELKNEN